MIRFVVTVAVAVAIAGCSSSSRSGATLALKPCAFGAIKARCVPCRRPSDAGRTPAPADPDRRRGGPRRAIPAPSHTRCSTSRTPPPATEDTEHRCAGLLGEVNGYRDLASIDQRGPGHPSRSASPARPQPEFAHVAASCYAARATLRGAERPGLRYDTSAAAVDDFDVVRAAWVRAD